MNPQPRANRLPLLLAGLLPALAPALAAEPPASSPLQESLARLFEPHLSAAVIDAAGRTIEMGGLVLELHSGALRALVDAADAPVGFAFLGKGSFRFRPDYADGSLVIRQNVRTILGAGHLQDGDVVGKFDRALALGRSPDLPDLREEEPADERVPGLERVFRDLLLSYRRTERAGIDHRLAQAEGNGVPPDVLHVEMRGNAGNILFVRDRARETQESLFKLERNGKVSVPRRLAVRPLIQAPRLGRAADYLVSGVRLSVRESGGLRLEIEGELELVPRQAGQRVLRLALRNHQARRDVPWDHRKRVLRVESVTDGDGRPLPFSHRYHELLVAFPEPLAAGQPAKVAFRLQADIAVRPSGDSYFLLRTLPWFPRSPVDAEAYRLDWRVETASPFLPLMSGETRAAREEEGWSVRRTVSELPVRFAAVVAGKFRCLDFPGDRGPRIRICNYLNTQPRLAPDLAAYFAALIEDLGRRLGPYPFSELTVVEIPTIDLAQATPGMILLSTEILLPNASTVSRRLNDAADRLPTRRSRAVREMREALVGDAPKRMAHELAHTWWGQMAKYASPGDQWLSESFAEYFGGIALSSVAGPELMDQLRAVWTNAARRSNDAATLHTAHLLAGPEGFSRWFDLMYGKGPLVVDAIRAELGDDAFFASMRRLLRESRGDLVSTADLTAAIRAECGRDVGPLLERLFYGPDLPGE